MTLDPVHLVLQATGLAATVVLSLLGWSLQRNVKTQDGAIKAVHDDVRAVRSDLRVIDNDVREHSQSIGGLTERTQGLAERITAVEADVKEVVRDGCAHRRACAGEQK